MKFYVMSHFNILYSYHSNNLKWFPFFGFFFFSGNVWGCQEALLLLWRSCTWWTSSASRLGCHNGQLGRLYILLPKATFQVWKCIFKLFTVHRWYQVETYTVGLPLNFSLKLWSYCIFKLIFWVFYIWCSF